MKEVNLTIKELLLIKSLSIDKYVTGSGGEVGVVKAVIESFISYCNSKGYIVKEGKVFIEQQERNI